jgi:hypothetical protein
MPPPVTPSDEEPIAAGERQIKCYIVTWPQKLQRLGRGPRVEAGGRSAPRRPTLGPSTLTAGLPG